MRRLLVCTCCKGEILQILTEFAVCDRRGKEWDEVDKAETERLKLKKTEDGEFWYVAHTETHSFIVQAKWWWNGGVQNNILKVLKNPYV